MPTEAEYEDVLKVDAVDLRQLRCLVKELGRENFERLINSDYTPSLEVLILAANCQVALEALLLGPVTPEAVPTVPPAAPTTTSLPQAEPEATPASQARAVVQVPTTGPVETVQPGMLAPDFDLRFYEDRAEESLPQRLSDLRGTPVVLLFWFPDCEPCKTNLANMENEFRGARWVGAKFIGVQILGSPQESQATVADSGLSYHFVLDEQGDVSRQYGVNQVPTTVVLKSDHTVANRHVGQLLYLDELRMLLERTLGPSLPPPTVAPAQAEQ